MTKRLKIILLSLSTICAIMTIGFNQEQPLNFTQYDERRQVWLEIALVVHVATILLLTIYYYFKRNNNIAVTFLICLGLEIITLLISAILMASNFEGIQLKF